MKRIIINFIPQKEQRFDCVQEIGDYFETENTIHFKITEFYNPIYSFACLIHELHEKFRNNQLGIKDEDVDKFDLNHPELDDKGMSPLAPYHKTHCEADALERLFVVLAGGSWPEYEDAINDLFNKPEYSKDSPESLARGFNG